MNLKSDAKRRRIARDELSTNPSTDWRVERAELRRKIKQATSRAARLRKELVRLRESVEDWESRIETITPPSPNSLEVQCRLSERYFLAHRLETAFGWKAKDIAVLFGVNPSTAHRILDKGAREARSRPWPGVGVTDQRQPTKKPASDPQV